MNDFTPGMRVTAKRDQALADARAAGVKEGLELAARFVTNASSRSVSDIPSLAMHAGLRALVRDDAQLALTTVVFETERIRALKGTT